MTDSEKWEALRAYLNNKIQWCQERERDFGPEMPKFVKVYLARKKLESQFVLLRMEELDNA